MIGFGFGLVGLAVVLLVVGLTGSGTAALVASSVVSFSAFLVALVAAALRRRVDRRTTPDGLAG